MGNADWTEPPKAWLDTAADTAGQLVPSQSTAQVALLVLGVSQLTQAALSAYCVRCSFTGVISCNLGAQPPAPTACAQSIAMPLSQLWCSLAGFNLFGKPLGAALRVVCREDTASVE